MPIMEIQKKANAPFLIGGAVYGTPGFTDRLQEELHVHAWLSQKRSKQTRRNYDREIRCFFRKFPGLSIKSLTDKHVLAFIIDKRDLSAAYQNFAKDVVSSLLRYCVRIGYLSRNVADSLDKIRVPTKIAFRTMSESQVKLLLEFGAREAPRDRLLVRLLFYTGTRVSEAISLRWSSFRLDREKVQVSLYGKGGKVRSILISKELYRDLQFLRCEQNSSANDFVFVSQKEPFSGISATTAWRIVKRIAKKAGLPSEISPHFIRHAHALLALRGGADLRVLQQTLGHASLQTTGIYLETFPEESSGEYLPVF